MKAPIYKEWDEMTEKEKLNQLKSNLTDAFDEIEKLKKEIKELKAKIL